MARGTVVVIIHKVDESYPGQTKPASLTNEGEEGEWKKRADGRNNRILRNEQVEQNMDFAEKEVEQRRARKNEMK